MPPKRRTKSWGSGSIRQREDGRWQVQVFVTESVTGRRVRRSLYGSTKAEVTEKWDALVAAEAKREPIPSSQLTLGDYLPEWLDQVVRPRVRPTTLKTYKTYVDKYLVPDLGKKPLGRLSARELRLYLDELRRRGVTDYTVKYVHATLRAALEDAVREEVIARNVAKLVRVRRPVRKPAEPLSVDEVKRLLKFHAEDRILPMLVVFALLGMRRSEVLGLKWTDVDLDRGTLVVERGLHRVASGLIEMPTKTDRSNRTIPLPGLLVTLLRARHHQQEIERKELAKEWPDLGYVFTSRAGTPIDPRNCTRQVQKACENAGVRVVRLHDFRHGAISVLLELGVPPRTAMEIAGHTNLEVTMNIYGHVNMASKRSALDQVANLFDDAEESK